MSKNAGIPRGGITLKKMSLWQFAALIAVLALISPGAMFADVSKQTKDSLDKLLLGKKSSRWSNCPLQRKDWMSISSRPTASALTTEGWISAK